MLKNPLHKYSVGSQMVPMHLNFGRHMIEKLMEYKHQMWINGQTGEAITHGDIARQAMNFAVSLSQLGVGKGQAVALCSENREEFWATAIGSVCTGATFTPYSNAYTESELTHVLTISNPSVIICSPTAFKRNEKTFRSFSNKIIIFGKEKLPNTISFDELVVAHDVRFEDFKAADVDGTRDIAFLLYSSGTTGLPKGVMLTHLNVLIACTATIINRTSHEGIIHLMTVPWFHGLGLNFGLLVLSLGWRVVYLPKYDTELALKCIEKYKITTVNTVPAILVALTKHPKKYDVSSVEVIFSGAAPIKKETLEAVKKMFPKVSDVNLGYGMTECCLGVMRNLGESPPSKLGTVGQVTPGLVVKVVDVETGKLLGPNRSGEIYVKGGNVMKGYVGKDPREDFDDEGFFRTGDVGYYDDDGDFYIVDRLKELIKYNAYQVSPAEIEAVLLEHPGVRDAGVVGVLHPGAGEVPRAFVALQPGASVSAEELKQLVAQKLSNPKHLRGGVRFIPEVPKNPSGKILRRVLRTMVDSKL